MDFRYDQFCPIARVCEILGSRWTLLVLRNLFTGPQRFSDLQRTLPGISSSVLTQRLEQLEKHGLVSKRKLPPPAASRVYDLTGSGHDLKPALFELLRWGLRFMTSTKPDDHVEAAWVPIGLEALARTSPSPDRTIEIRVRGNEQELVVVTVRGGPGGTTVTRGATAADVSLEADPRTLLGMALGVINPAQAMTRPAVRVEGDVRTLDVFPQFFQIQANTDTIAATDPSE